MQLVMAWVKDMAAGAASWKALTCEKGLHSSSDGLHPTSDRLNMSKHQETKERLQTSRHLSILAILNSSGLRPLWNTTLSDETGSEKQSKTPRPTVRLSFR